METFHVKNYKGLKDLELKGLSRVNLIVGRNNVGKSSLLEAISLCVSKGNSSELLDIMEYGGERVSNRSSSSGEEKGLDNESHFLSIFCRTGFDGQRAPIIFFAEDKYSVTFEVGYQKEKRVRQGSSVSHLLEYISETDYMAGAVRDGVPAEKGIAIKAGDSFQFIPFHSEFQVFPESLKNCGFVRPVDFFLLPNAALYDKIAMTDKEDKLLAALRIIEPQIQKINYLESEPGSRKRVPFVVVGENMTRVRLSSMGDGINRILTIILSLLNCPAGGALAIDEIDNGLHFSVQKQLWEMVFSLAKELDVQIFATTHSMDCLRSFAQVNANGDGLLIRLDVRQNGDIVPQYYSDSEDIRFAVEIQIELR